MLLLNAKHLSICTKIYNVRAGWQEPWVCFHQIISFAHGGGQHHLLCTHCEHSRTILEFTCNKRSGGHRIASPSIPEQRTHNVQKTRRAEPKKIWAKCEIPLHNTTPSPPCVVHVPLRMHTIRHIILVRQAHAPSWCGQRCDAGNTVTFVLRRMQTPSLSRMRTMQGLGAPMG